MPPVGKKTMDAGRQFKAARREGEKPQQLGKEGKLRKSGACGRSLRNTKTSVLVKAVSPAPKRGASAVGSGAKKEKKVASCPAVKRNFSTHYSGLRW